MAEDGLKLGLLSHQLTVNMYGHLNGAVRRQIFQAHPIGRDSSIDMDGAAFRIGEFQCGFDRPALCKRPGNVIRNLLNHRQL